jgi:hypothetical protein
MLFFHRDTTCLSPVSIGTIGAPLSANYFIPESVVCALYNQMICFVGLLGLRISLNYIYLFFLSCFLLLSHYI